LSVSPYPADRLIAGVAPPLEATGEVPVTEVTGAVPLDAAVISPFPLTVTLALVNEPTLVLTVASVVVLPTEVTSPVRLALVTTVATLPTEVTPPVRLALVVTVPAVKPAAVPVMFVPTSVEGVPRFGVTRVGLFDSTTEPVPVAVLKSVRPASQLAAVVPVIRIHVHIAVVPGNTVMTKLPPDELTVTLPVLLLTM